jgi:hypothetical protein
MSMFVIMITVSSLFGLSAPSIQHIVAPDQAACEQMAEMLNQQYRASRDISATARCLSILPAGSFRDGSAVPSAGIADVLGRPKPADDAYGPPQPQQKGATQ